MSKRNHQPWPQPQQERVVNPVVRASRQEFTYSGPLPPPAMLQQYNEIEPGLADRIVKMAEGQSAHRKDLESKVISSDIKNSRLGIICGLSVVMACITGAVLTSIFGNQYVAGALGLGSLGTLAGTFIYGTNSRKKERDSRKDSDNE